MNTPQQLHKPVLLKAVLDVLKPQKGESYLDLTAGYGGHARAVLEKTQALSLATLVDRDDKAIAAQEPLRAAGAEIIKSDFATAAEELASNGRQFKLILIDLGVSSPQLDNADRGFSFMHEGPLDMRMDPSKGFNAADLVNKASREELTKILREYGEEPHASKIALAIVQARPFATTTQLADVVANVFRGRRGKIHPATRTFQALRIAVNDELQQLSRTLKLLPQLLAQGGRVAIISFHSLEDRLVKQYFKEQAEAGYEATLSIITKQPISGAIQDVSNPRSRSAKLRAAQRK